MLGCGVGGVVYFQPQRLCPEELPRPAAETAWPGGGGEPRFRPLTQQQRTSSACPATTYPGGLPAPQIQELPARTPLQLKELLRVSRVLPVKQIITAGVDHKSLSTCCLPGCSSQQRTSQTSFSLEALMFWR